MAAGEEAVDIGLGVPVFVAVAGVAEETVVAEAFQVAVLDAEERHECFVVVNARVGFRFWGRLGVEFGEPVIYGFVMRYGLRCRSSAMDLGGILL